MKHLHLLDLERIKSGEIVRALLNLVLCKYTFVLIFNFFLLFLLSDRYPCIAVDKCIPVNLWAEISQKWV